MLVKLEHLWLWFLSGTSSNFKFKLVYCHMYIVDLQYNEMHFAPSLTCSITDKETYNIQKKQTKNRHKVHSARQKDRNQLFNSLWNRLWKKNCY